MKIKVKQNKSFFTDFAKKYKEEYVELLEEAAQNIETEATAAAPVDLGILKSSINKEIEGLNAIIGSTVKYSPFIEFGTGGRVNIPDGLETYAAGFKGANQDTIGITPHPFLMPAARKHVTIMVQELQKLDLNKIK